MPTSSAVRAYYRRVLPFYELELADRGDEEMWTWAASAPSSCRVLELGAGSGRATAFLARSAGFIVALDLAPEMIAVARRRLARASNVALAVADMREIELRLRFDLVAAVDDPFVHLVEDEDRQRAFATAARHLAPGGRFILDAAWFPPDRRWTAGGVDGLIQEHSGGDGLEIRETWHCDPKARLCTASYAYSREGETVERVSFPARLWSREELEHRAVVAGLRVTHLWGGYDRRPWDRTTSPRMIAELRVAR
jgi:SAM-dependent methyltransferase